MSQYVGKDNCRRTTLLASTRRSRVTSSRSLSSSITNSMKYSSLSTVPFRYRVIVCACRLPPVSRLPRFHSLHSQATAEHPNANHRPLPASTAATADREQALRPVPVIPAFLLLRNHRRVRHSWQRLPLNKMTVALLDSRNVGVK